ncbi:hypothetical protein [Streptomyces griseus]
MRRAPGHDPPDTPRARTASVHGRPRRRHPVLAALLLCAAPIASAAPGTTEGHPPAHGAAPPYISDYTDNTVLRLPPGGGDPVTVPAEA